MANVPKAWNFNVDFIGRMRPILWTSAALTVLSLAALWGIGLNLGTDFAGGYEIQVQFADAVDEGRIRDVLEPMQLGETRVQRFGGESENAFLILVREAKGSLSPEAQQAVRQAVEALVPKRTDVTDLVFAESGETLTARFAAPVALDKFEAELKRLGVRVTHVARGGREERPEFTVHTESLADDVAKQLVAGLTLKDTSPRDLLKRVEFVGPQVGAELRNQGLLAVAYSLLLILIYVAVRFDMYFAPGAIVATLHDIILTMGIFCVFRVDFNLTVVAAILTLIGFSLNDTIVVYDRIRENVARSRNTPLPQIVNAAINETMSRTILTSGTVALVCAALVALGGPLLRGFSVTMLIGVVVGTYSSVAVASPVYIALRRFGERAGERATAGAKGESPYKARRA